MLEIGQMLAQEIGHKFHKVYTPFGRLVSRFRMISIEITPTRRHLWSNPMVQQFLAHFRRIPPDIIDTILSPFLAVSPFHDLHAEIL